MVVNVMAIQPSKVKSMEKMITQQRKLKQVELVYYFFILHFFYQSTPDRCMKKGSAQV